MNARADIGKAAAAAFRDRESAENALRSLHEAGFTDDEIGIAVRDDSEQVDKSWVAAMEEQAGSDAVTGVAAGGVLGAILGAGLAIAIPGVGTAIGAGIIAGSIASGAFAGGLVGPLVSLGVDEDQAQFLEEEFRSGSIILTVHTEDRAEEAHEILEQHGGHTLPA